MHDWHYFHGKGLCTHSYSHWPEVFYSTIRTDQTTLQYRTDATILVAIMFSNLVWALNSHSVSDWLILVQKLEVCSIWSVEVLLALDFRITSMCTELASLLFHGAYSKQYTETRVLCTAALHKPSSHHTRFHDGLWICNSCLFWASWTDNCFLFTAGVSQGYWGGDGPQDEQEPQEQQADAQWDPAHESTLPPQHPTVRWYSMSGSSFCPCDGIVCMSNSLCMEHSLVVRFQWP